MARGRSARRAALSEAATYERWQLKPTAKGSARIWYYVHERTVHLEQVHTSHPHETL